MVFTSDFPGGNGKLLSAALTAEGWDVRFLAESKGHEPQPLWFYFRLSGLENRPVRLFLANSAQCLGWAERWDRNRPVYRADGVWKRFETVSCQRNGDGTLSTVFSLPALGDTVEVAFCFPYGDGELEETIRSCPGLQETVIGYTGLGAPIRRLFFDAGEVGSDRPGIFLQARQHSGEVTGSWVMDGVLRWLASPEGEEARTGLCWWFVPFADTDGVAQGWYGKDQFLGDFNHAWAARFPGRTGIMGITYDFWQWKERTRPVLGFDLHAPSHQENDSYINVDAEVTEPGRSQLRAICEGTSAGLTAAGYHPLRLNEKKPGLVTSSQNGMTFPAFCRHNGVTGGLMEISYQGEPGRYYDIEDYRQMGVALAKAITKLYLG